MSDKNPTITVTRGSRQNRSRRTDASDGGRSRSSSTWGVPGPGTLVSGLVRGVRNVWWAGLGVLAVAEEAGSQVFDALVEEGKSWEQARRERARAKTRRVQRLADEDEAVEAVEEQVREEMDTILRRMGLPRRDDVAELHDRVDALTQQVERLSESVEGASEDSDA